VGKKLAREERNLLMCDGVNRSSLLAYFSRFAPRQAALWLAVWAALGPSPAPAAEELYTVKRGDTIFGIAQRYGIPQATLAERNGLSRSFHIYAGQQLRVPVKPGAKRPAPAARAAAPKNGRAALPRSIQQAIDRAPVRPGRWQYIVLHHSDVDTGTVKAMDKYHREVRHMENGLAYHFVICNGSGMEDGEIAVCHRWTAQLDGGHLASNGQNQVALGICLVGNFDKHPPSSRQMESLRRLVEALMARCQLTPRAVKTHQQINIVKTRCPGSQFPFQSFLSSLATPSR
jgi:LysM repeat protein